MSATPAPTSSERFAGLDALRGIAAMMVLVFHFSTRFGQIYSPSDTLGFTFVGGKLGVQLFFMISGFVILMTLDRTSHPIDFLVSRFSRLYPVFWVAVLITGAVELSTHILAQGYDLRTVLMNLLMFHGYLHVADIDGAYWTLQVELFFYLCMLAIWLVHGARNFRPVLAVWLGVSLVASFLLAYTKMRVPTFLVELAVLDYIPWFAVGMLIFLRKREGAHAMDPLLMVLALSSISINKDTQTWIGWVMATYTVVLHVAITRPPRWLVARPLVWLGALSYPLYLVHENLGYTLMLTLDKAGVSAWPSFACAVAGALALAWLLHVGVEGPAMAAVRRAYRSSAARAASALAPLSPLTRRRHQIGLAGVMVLLIMGNRFTLG